MAGESKTCIPEAPFNCSNMFVGRPPGQPRPAMKTHKAGKMGVREPLRGTTDRQIRKGLLC